MHSGFLQILSFMLKVVFFHFLIVSFDPQKLVLLISKYSSFFSFVGFVVGVISKSPLSNQSHEYLPWVFF